MVRHGRHIPIKAVTVTPKTPFTDSFCESCHPVGDEADTLALYIFTEAGLNIAERLCARFSCFIHAPESMLPAVASRAFPSQTRVSCFRSLAEIMRDSFTSYRCHIFISATGIAVRAIAPHLSSKLRDPAVIVIDQKARHVISLLSGHVGGANAMTVTLAEMLDATPVITTATDVEGLPAIDLAAQASGLAIANAAAVKHINAALLRKEPVRLYDPLKMLKLGPDPALSCFQPLEPVSAPDRSAERESIARLPSMKRGPAVLVTEYDFSGELPEEVLVLHPRLLAAGIGCKRGTDAQSIVAFIEAVFQRFGLALQSLRCLATLDVKRDEQGLLEAAAYLDIPLFFFTAGELSAYPVSAPSPKARSAFGLAGVCEPAALAAAGQGEKPSCLLVQKQKWQGITLSVARAGQLTPLR